MQFNQLNSTSIRSFQFQVHPSIEAENVNYYIIIVSVEDNRSR
jgi:hypothetical protein